MSRYLELHQDVPIPLPELPAVIEAEYGRKVTRQTVWLWARRGLSLPGGDRARLQTFERGRKLYSTRQWLRWFMNEG